MEIVIFGFQGMDDGNNFTLRESQFVRQESLKCITVNISICTVRYQCCSCTDIHIGCSQRHI